MLLVDRIKAFDTAHHGLLVPLLTHFGAPHELAVPVKNLYTEMMVQFSTGQGDVEIDYACGVQQGDHMEPLVFLFSMQAAVSLVNGRLAALGVDPLKFKHPIHRELGFQKSNGQAVSAHGISFSANELLNADNGEFVFLSCVDLIVAFGVIEEQFACLGLHMHCGSGSKKSKYVAMFIPKNMSLQFPDGGELSYSFLSGGNIHFAC